MKNTTNFFKFILSYTALFLCIFSCQRKDKTLSDYVKNPRNGLSKENIINGVKYEMSYRPSRFFVENEQRRKPDINRDSLENFYNKNYYFLLELSSGNLDLMRAIQTDREQFGKMVHQLAFKMENSTTMITNKKDTIPVAMSHFVRTYGMSPKNTIILAFNNDKVKDANWLKIKLKDIGLNSGDMSFKFKVKDIKETPK